MVARILTLLTVWWVAVLAAAQAPPAGAEDQADRILELEARLQQGQADLAASRREAAALRARMDDPEAALPAPLTEDDEDGNSSSRAQCSRAARVGNGRAGGNRDLDEDDTHFVSFGIAAGILRVPNPGLRQAGMRLTATESGDLERTFLLDQQTRWGMSSALTLLVSPWPYRADEGCVLRQGYKFLSRLSFAASLNFFDTSSISQGGESNVLDYLQGGVGVALRLGGQLHLGFFVEYRRVRTARQGVTDNGPVPRSSADGGYPDRISLSDDRFFQTKGRAAWSLRLIYTFTSLYAPPDASVQKVPANDSEDEDD